MKKIYIPFFDVELIMKLERTEDKRKQKKKNVRRVDGAEGRRKRKRKT